MQQPTAPILVISQVACEARLTNDSWRQQQIIAAQPIADLQGSMVSADDVIGADLCNPRDQQLGSIDDVIVDPRSGSITCVIIAKGGFLGIAEDHFAVPWSRLKATPGMKIFVLDARDTSSTMRRRPTRMFCRFSVLRAAAREDRRLLVATVGG